MNFHPDKQLFQVAGTRDQTTDPWITMPALYLYTMGAHLPYWILVHFSKTLKSFNLVDTTKRTTHPGADKE
jgi:cytochrome c biogenesis protein CcdA